MDFSDNNICPVCLRTFKTPGGKHAHMSSAKSCSWYRFGKLADLHPLDYGDNREGGAMGIQPLDGGGPNESENENEGDDTVDIFNELIEQEEELFHFVPQSPQSLLRRQIDTDIVMGDGEAGPGPSTLANSRSRFYDPRTLDDSDDNRIKEIHPTAGRMIRMDESLHRRWKKVFGKFQSRDDNGGDIEMLEEQEDNPYLPFASELDWRIVQLVIKYGPGQNSFDRLLKIPGVCQPFNYKLLFNAFLILIKQVKEKLGLSYHNTQPLHQILDNIPDHAGKWQT
jgi:hypothetical protein